MVIKKVDLYEYFGIERVSGAQGYLDLYLHESTEGAPNRVRPAMLVLAGGGYGFVSKREQEPIALRYMVEGFNAFALHYSVFPVTFPAQLIEACMAMCYIRENAKELCIMPDKVCAVGFSAGGHLCASLSNMYNFKEVIDVLGVDRAKLARPDASILSYPVITAKEPTHIGSFLNLTNANENLYERLSVENQVTIDTPPAFIWATFNDGCVPCENSFAYAIAMKKVGVPFEMHIFEDGVHGISLATKEVSTEGNEQAIDRPELNVWVNLSVTWLKNRGFILKNKGE